MTVRCPSCSANLKVNLDRLGNRENAKCPGCQASVPLNRQQDANKSESLPPASSTIVVTCQSCKTRLKAPASRVGTRSACPRCRTAVLIEPPTPSVSSNVLVAAAGAEPQQEEVSSASTRRIDSRMIDMLSSARRAEGVTGSVDLEAFLKTGSTDATPSRSESPGSTPASDTGSVAPLLNPPVADLERVAREIRQTALNLTTRPGAGASSPTTEPATAASQPHRPMRHAHEATESHAPSTTPLSDRTEDRLFPAWRGLLSGALAGLVVGAAQAGMMMTPFASFLPPLPFPPAMLEIPEMALRIGLLLLLGSLAGFIAGSMGSPRYSNFPLSLIRCGGATLLTGLACGLMGGLVTGSGVQVWPIANWMRDLLLVGLLTPALNKLVPLPRN